jgi:hypothetical protein
LLNFGAYGPCRTKKRRKMGNESVGDEDEIVAAAAGAADGDMPDLSPVKEESAAKIRWKTAVVKIVEAAKQEADEEKQERCLHDMERLLRYMYRSFRAS